MAERDEEAQARRDMETLAEAARIRDDDERRKAARRAAKNRKADELAGKGSLAAKLRARRQAVESGDIENAQTAYNTGEYDGE